jgi:hypothetical protein
MKAALAAKLDTIERQVRWWMDFDRGQREREGLSTDDSTAIMSPPMWPTHGSLKAWAEALKEAREDALR